MPRRFSCRLVATGPSLQAAQQGSGEPMTVIQATVIQAEAESNRAGVQRSEGRAAPAAGRFAGVHSRAELHALVAPFAHADSAKGYLSFAIDLAMFAGGIAIVLLAPAIAGKIAGGLLAGFGMVALGSLSHEAAHRAVVRSRLGNKIIAVVSLTVILFNYRLWVYDHHVLHHGRTNVRNANFYTPLTLAEYRALPAWRRALYRAYRSETALGILLYYVIERWPTVHFWPGEWLPQRFHRSARGYALLEAAYAAGLVTLLSTVASARGESVMPVLLCGFVLPVTIWFAVFSFTAFLQHTHPRLRWYHDDAPVGSPPEMLATQVPLPRWLNHMTHYVMEHPVHHLSAMVPHYNLKRAQDALAGIADPALISVPLSLADVRNTLRSCKLYDYEAHVWTDYAGKVTGIPDDTARARAAASTSLLPDVADASPGIFFPDTASQPARA